MARLVVIAGPDLGKTFELSDTQVLGRDRDATFPLADNGTSRKHIRVWRSSDGYSVIDLESKNGTWVNGERISRAALSEGDVIVIGETHLRIEGAAVIPAPKSPTRPTTAGTGGVEVRTAAGKISEKAITAKKERADGALDIDISQYGPMVRWFIYLGITVLIAAIVWIAWKFGGGTMPT